MKNSLRKTRRYLIRKYFILILKREMYCCNFYPQPPKGGIKQIIKIKSPLGDLGVNKVK
jgi:hypothetical protein